MIKIWGYIILLLRWAKKNTRTAIWGLFGIFILLSLTLAGGKIYQNLDRDPDRGGIEIQNAYFGDSYSTPIYLDQGWLPSDSLWFYNTTQGSNLLPYDMFLALEQAENKALFRDEALIDKYRYLPQKPTFFNPDGLPVGFVRDEYDGNSYVGYTCAACHTGQVNYKGKAIRIDGGPSMANMPGFLKSLEKALIATRDEPAKRKRFVEKVLELDINYDDEKTLLSDLAMWTKITQQYNVINHSKVDYGYARLDAFGRIYNRVLKYVINKEQLRKKLITVRDGNKDLLLTAEQVEFILNDVGPDIITRDDFLTIIDRLSLKENGGLGLSLKHVLRIRNTVFNEPNAPVSYPFLWGTAHSDYVQWNGIASNASAGPIGRNVGEVMGVFGTLDWTANEPGFFDIDIAGLISGQSKKAKVIDFQSSVDLTNLHRLEGKLGTLKSPAWPEEILGSIDTTLAVEGERIYAEYCASCHEVVDPNNWDRLIVAQMSGLDVVKTDPAMAENSVMYKGASGNFKHTYQTQDVGKLVIEEIAPAAVILTSATRGVVGTPDHDKSKLRSTLDWVYVMASSFFKNHIEASVKNGNYTPDTTAGPFNSLVAYKARPLNGIWATAPYLHNGSVPTLYDLLLPAKRDGDTEDGEYRPDEFMVGSREYDVKKVGYLSEGYEGFRFLTDRRGNFNTGHEYAAGITAGVNGEVLPALTKEERWALVEFMKTL